MDIIHHLWEERKKGSPPCFDIGHTPRRRNTKLPMCPRRRKSAIHVVLPRLSLSEWGHMAARVREGRRQVRGRLLDCDLRPEVTFHNYPRTHGGVRCQETRGSFQTRGGGRVGGGARNRSRKARESPL